jgi:hypothetical protein
MRRERTESQRDPATELGPDVKPAKRLQQHATTKQMHQRLLRALHDRRLRRAFD